MGGESEGEDADLSKRFEAFKNAADPQRKTKLAAHLNLLWSVSEVS